ncbi:YahG/YlbE-like protein [Mycobacterium goodii]|nr:YahG/YlbE-like protein [Mycolicibacterium goodii]
MAAMLRVEPVIVDVAPALTALPGMTPRTILTSGAPMEWPEYTGGQRRAILGAAIYEGLAETSKEADALLHGGEIRVRACHDHGCVGSVTGVTSASMPVWVVEDLETGRRGHCVLYEGSDRQRLTYGVWNDTVRRRLLWIREVLAPQLSTALRNTAGVPVNPIIRRALGMGDDLHSRNTAATALLFQQLFDAVLEANGAGADTREILAFLGLNDLFFLHVAMAAGKCIADAAAGIRHSTIVTAMALNEKHFALRVAGSGDTWFRAPLPELHAKLYDGIRPDDIAFMGGESLITETVGLGGLAAAAAFSLQDYSGGTADAMVRTTQEMYGITRTEHPSWKIPFLGFRGVPFGIEADVVASTGVTPRIHMGAALREGGQAGAGLLIAPAEPFQAAVQALEIQ